jgi:hypothetical protein
MRYRDGKVATRLELRSLSDGGSDDFEFTPPEGLPVAEEANDEDLPPEPEWTHGMRESHAWSGEWTHPGDSARIAADAVKKQVDEKISAARGFLGSFLGGRR